MKRSTVATKKPAPRKTMTTKRRFKRSPPIATNTAAVRENYSVSINDGTMNFFYTALNDLIFDRAQAVAKNFQEYRIKYVKLIFRPSADTWPVGSGPVPQLYFQMNKYATIPTGIGLNQLLDMGCRPIRFDDKNITRSYKPVVLLGANDTSAPQILSVVAAVKVSPWLSTNFNAGTPTSWSPSNVEHQGCVFYVTKPSPTTPTIAYNVDVEIVFQFRRPLSLAADTEPYNTISGGQAIYHDVSGNVVQAPT